MCFVNGWVTTVMRKTVSVTRTVSVLQKMNPLTLAVYETVVDVYNQVIEKGVGRI